MLLLMEVVQNMGRHAYITQTHPIASGKKIKDTPARLEHFQESQPRRLLQKPESQPARLVPTKPGCAMRMHKT